MIPAPGASEVWVSGAGLDHRPEGLCAWVAASGKTQVSDKKTQAEAGGTTAQSSVPVVQYRKQV